MADRMQTRIAILAACGVSACATKIGDGGATQITTIDPQRDIAGLVNANERGLAGRFCLDVYAFLDSPFGERERERVACMDLAYGRASCKEAFESCMASPPAPPGEGDPIRCDLFVQTMTRCGDLKVGEYTQCLLDIATPLYELGRDAPASCDGARAEGIRSPSCAKVVARCPLPVIPRYRRY
jgi:hypothetical protein